MHNTLRLSAWFVVLGQCLTLVAAPIAVCSFAKPGEVAAHDCPHEMTTGATCPMHAAPVHSEAQADGDRWREDCNSDTESLSWLNVPAQTKEAIRVGRTLLDSQPAFAVPLPSHVDLAYAPSSPPPRA